MAEVNNDANNDQAEDSQGQPANNGQVSSDNKPDATELARREQQSKKDKVTSQKDELAEQVEFLSAKEAERARDSYVSELVSDKSKYPNVEANDPLFKYATSKEEVEEIAKDIQNRYTTLQQKALSDVQSEPDQTLTDEQVEEEEKKLEEDAVKRDTSRFSDFLNIQARRKR